MPGTPGARGPEGIHTPGSEAGVAGAHRTGRVRGSWRPAWLPLVLVLVAQAGLSVRLFGADTAFQDEAEYLWAGHLEWSHWLHGTVVPPFPSYFSGAPVIYPPLGALADAVGGLAGARLLSLLFMLGATALLWAVTGGCSGAGPRSFPARCSRCPARCCTWARSPPMTPCRCSSWRWRPGWW